MVGGVSVIRAVLEFVSPMSLKRCVSVIVLAFCGGDRNRATSFEIFDTLN